MSIARRRDTLPELLIRREAHRRGLRYRVDAPLPGLPRRRADMLFASAKIAVFVDGCFWHACPLHSSVPRANREWWSAKLTKNVDRDRATDTHLTRAGWRSLRFWEHEDVTAAVDVIMGEVELRRPSRATRQQRPDGVVGLRVNLDLQLLLVEGVELQNGAQPEEPFEELTQDVPLC